MSLNNMNIRHKFMKQKTSFLLHALSWATLIIALLSYYANLSEQNYGMVFSSDSVGLPALYKDVAMGNGELKDVYFAAAPTVFPDILLYHIITKLFGFSLQRSALLYACFILVMITLLSVNIFRKCCGDDLKRYSWLVPLGYSMFLLECCYFTHDIFITHLLTSYSYHIGSFFNCLLALSIYLSAWPKALRFSLLFIFSTLAAFSDMLFIVMLTAPLTISCLVQIRRSNIWQPLLNIVSVGGGSVLGLKIYGYISESGKWHFFKPHKMFAYSDIKPSLDMFTEQMVTYMSFPGFRSFQLLFTFAAIPVCLFLVIRKRKSMAPPLRFLLFFFVVFSLSVLAAPIINGNYSGYDTLRYNVAPFCFSMVILALFFAFLIERKIRGNFKLALSFAFPCALLFMAFLKYNTKGLNYYLTYYPPKIRTTDSVCAKYGLTDGISEYWTARLTSVLSKNNVRIQAVYDACTINELGNDITHYYKSKFNFVVADGLDTARVHKFFRIKDTVVTPYHTILLVDPFTFPAGTYEPLTPGLQK
jgi:hypothetical protein